MRISAFLKYILWFIGVTSIGTHLVCAQTQTRSVQQLYAAVDTLLVAYNATFTILGTVKRESVRIDTNRKEVHLYMNEILAYLPMRPQTVAEIHQQFKAVLPEAFADYTLTLYSKQRALHTLIPNIFRQKTDYDSARLPRNTERPIPLRQSLNRPYEITLGLQNRYIALWHSHGWYYEPTLDRWEWQRARVFQTVEDLLPMGFVLPYLAPMLENAGATVFIPRERDWQTQEVVVDNDSPAFGYQASNGWQTDTTAGFLPKSMYVEGENPFLLGSYQQTESALQPTDSIRWIPQFTKAGEYAVYVSYQSLPNSTETAYYTVHHSGGITQFKVNQTIGGGTWLYLGRFRFNRGKAGKVVLTNQSDKQGKVVSADAVRFGGGMGSIARKGSTSQRPRFVEAARYYFQYSGTPDTLVYHLNENNDYRDDYQSRGEWVSYLKGAPFGPQKNREAKGLGIPIDLSLAFHTDAGFTRNDTVVGTLMIHSTAADEGIFPDSVSRLASRDFADLLQTQIVEDIRQQFDSTWVRRGLWDKDYSEAYRPTVPAALLELLSHHNFTDMKFAQDPRFRFQVSRSIYKAILRYLAHSYGMPYQVQPLPVAHLQATFTEPNVATLTWLPVADSLSPGAEPTGYVVYIAEEQQGFNNGTFTEKPSFTLKNLQKGRLYRLKVTAVNAGGESFPSEELAVCYQSATQPTVLIVNGFDRVAAPATLDTETLMGFANFLDEGVPDRYDLGFVGEQYDFNPDLPWLDDDAPGHGASHADYETQVIAGNTFNFVAVHAEALRETGLNIASTSDEAVAAQRIDLSAFPLLDWIAGEEKSTPSPKYLADTSFRVFPEAVQKALAAYTRQGGSLLVSGAYIGTDLAEGKPKEHPDVRFAKEVLQMQWRTNHASKQGEVVAVHEAFRHLPSFQFNTEFSDTLYKVEAPDALEPATPQGHTIFRYANSKSAGIAYKQQYGIVALGFPFETVTDATQRAALMRAIIAFLLDK